MYWSAFAAFLLLCPACACAQTIAERFEFSAKKQRPAAIKLLEERIEDRRLLLDAAKRGPINQAKNDYSKVTAPDGQVLHNFSFRTAADRRDVTARYQKQLSDAARDLKDLKSETAWPCPIKALSEVEVGDFICLAGEYRIAFKEGDSAAWIEKSDPAGPACFYLHGADLSRYADNKEIDFVDAKNEVVFFVRGTRTKPDSLRVSGTIGQTLYEIEMVSFEELMRQLPAGVRVLKMHGARSEETERDLPTPVVSKK
jgi:hypothetical protein